jgi:hypothetical protein
LNKNPGYGKQHTGNLSPPPQKSKIGNSTLFLGSLSPNFFQISQWNAFFRVDAGVLAALLPLLP